MSESIEIIVRELEKLEPDRRGEILGKLEKIFSRIEYIQIMKGIMSPEFGVMQKEAVNG